MKKEAENRRHPRVNARWPLTVLSEHGRIEGETRNLSISGVLIQCDEDRLLAFACQTRSSHDPFLKDLDFHLADLLFISFQITMKLGWTLVELQDGLS